MTNRKILVGTLALLSLLIACGDDDDEPSKDAGADASDDASRADSGGAEAGKGGKGGQAGAGQGGAGGEGGSGGDSGEGGAGGEGGSGAGTYNIKGQVSGLTGTGLVLQNNGGDDLTVDAAGEFTFAAKLDEAEDYAVTVKTQPHEPTQACTVAMGSGKVETEDVTNVAITCATNKYTIGGTLTGLAGTGLKLKNNAGDENTPTGATFTFGTSLDSGATYNVTISAQPSGQTCGVASATGSVGGANVESVAVTCYVNPGLVVEPGFSGAVASWAPTGATTYTLKATTDAACDLTTMSCPNGVQTASAASPAAIGPLANDTVWYVQLIASHPGGVTAFSNKTATRPTKPKIDNSINVLATSNGVTYAGGAFTRFSVHTGSAVPVHKATGYPSELPNFPIIEGNVFGLAADGTGGYYVGGTFTNGLAHIKADGTIDTAWAPVVTGGIVNTIAVNNGTVYVAGSFTNIGGQNRAGLAAIAAADGAVSMTWNPNPTPANSVSTIAFWNSFVVLGGSFTNIAATAQSFIAMVDGTSGAIRSGWNPTPDGVVPAIAVNGDTVYVGGEFQNIGMQPRSRVAALNATGTDAAKAIAAFNPSANNAVYQLAYANNTVYVAGLLTSVGSTPAARSGIAAFNAADGAIKDWNPSIAPVTSVTTLTASADTVYIGGTFTSVNGTARNSAAAIDGTGPGTLTAWDPNPDGVPENYAFVGNSVVIGGQQRGIRGIVRNHLAAFDASGNLTTWNPGADNDVYALALSGSTIYVAGEFATLGGMPRDFVGAVDTAGGLSAWNPDADGPVFALAVTGDAVYMGGSFDGFGPVPSAHAKLAAFSLAAGSSVGAPLAWNPSANSVVRAIAVSGTNVYVGGDFTQLNSTARNHIGALTVSSATLVASWDPNITGTTVNALAATSDTLYAGGVFTTVGATARTNFVALSTAAPAVLGGLDVNSNGPVYSLLLANSLLYIGGDFTTVAAGPPVNRNHFAAYGALTTAPALEVGTDYIRNFDLAVRALSPGANGVIYAGGDFTVLGGVFTSGFGVIVPGQP
jgi:hypothetical protein